MGHIESDVWSIPLFNLAFDEREKAAVDRVLDRAWLTMGPEIEEFERRFAAFTGSDYCVAVSSCTAALHMALLVAGIGPGDEVIVPSFTFVATANAIRYVQAIPVFADIQSTSYPVIDPKAVEEKITSRTRAILIVHYGGYPCDMDAYTALAKTHNLHLIEDCAHSPGAKWDGKAVGTFGTAGCFSFFSNKNLSMGEGGAIVTSSETIFEKCKHLRSHGMTTQTLDRHKGHAYSYDVVTMGFNYRLDEIRAALGAVQLEKLPEMNSRRKELVGLYRRLLSELPVELPFCTYPKAHGVDHIMPIFLSASVDRKKLMQWMKQKGIQTSIHYPAIHHFSSFSDYKGIHLPITDSLSQRELTLPLYPSMSETDVHRVVSVLSGGIHDQTLL